MLPPPPARSQYSVLIRVTELVEPVLVFSPSFVSRVDLTGLASENQQVASKQQASSKHARNGGKSQLRPKFWWMLPMGVRDNHTKHEPKTQRWQPGTGVASAGPPFQDLQFRAKISLFFFLLKTALEPAQNGQKKRNCGYSTHAARLPRAEGPSRAL